MSPAGSDTPADTGAEYQDQGLGSLFLRLQISLPTPTNAPPSEEDADESRALQTLLGETQSRNVDGDNTKSSGGGAGGGVSGGRVSEGGGKVRVGAGGTGASGAGGVAPGTVARILGIPMSLWGTVKDVKVGLEGALDALEVRRGRGRYRNREEWGGGG